MERQENRKPMWNVIWFDEFKENFVANVIMISIKMLEPLNSRYVTLPIARKYWYRYLFCDSRISISKWHNRNKELPKGKRCTISMHFFLFAFLSISDMTTVVWVESPTADIMMHGKFTNMSTYSNFSSNYLLHKLKRIKKKLYHSINVWIFIFHVKKNANLSSNYVPFSREVNYIPWNKNKNISVALFIAIFVES